MNDKLSTLRQNTKILELLDKYTDIMIDISLDNAKKGNTVYDHIAEVVGTLTIKEASQFITKLYGYRGHETEAMAIKDIKDNLRDYGFLFKNERMVEPPDYEAVRDDENYDKVYEPAPDDSYLPF